MAGAMTETRIALIIGVGPGLGAAVARRFAAAGYALGLAARRAEAAEAVAAELRHSGARAFALSADTTDASSLAAAMATLREQAGDPEVLVYNAGSFAMGGILELAEDQFVAAWQANCLGAFLAAREVLPAMVAAGRGTILLSGATGSLRGGARFAGLAVGKFGLRALGQSMAREFGPQGIHVAHIVIDGQIDSPRTVARNSAQRPDDTYLHAADIAEAYWQLHAQPRSAWSHELDLRPHGEKF